MSNQPLSADLFAALRDIDTPTICNALEVVAPERRATGFTVEPLVCPFPDLKPIVGYARTATIRARQPAGISGDAMRQKRLDYYAYVEDGDVPKVSVIQDLDGQHKGFGAFWGEVNSNVHKALGCLGVVTDGSVRDIDMVAEGFQMLAGRIGPSHAHVHLVDYNVPVNVAGMDVKHGDLIHADRHGAVVIPHAVAANIPAAAEMLARKEAFTLEACKDPNFSVEMLRKAFADAEDIH
jgi:regulator of RNase E activity RraA